MSPAAQRLGRGLWGVSAQSALCWSPKPQSHRMRLLGNGVFKKIVRMLFHYSFLQEIAYSSLCCTVDPFISIQ